MTSKIDDGGLAFPGFRYQQVGTVADHGFSDDDSPTFGHVQHSGMSLRDWFAGQALSGMLAQDDGENWKAPAAAECAYKMADAMIGARKTADAA